MSDTTMDQSLNIGTEIKLFEGCNKHIRIGSIKLIRQVRKTAEDVRYRFRFSVGRGIESIGGVEIDFPAIEKTYKELFNVVLVEGLTDEEYESSDAEELEKVLDRFL